MNLLLDTHVALWAITDDPRLSVQARDLILNEANRPHVSVASIWEIAIKHSLSRGIMPVSAAEAAQAFRDSGFGVLAVAPEHAVAVESLPPIHRDPFDRLLVAQALNEPLHLVTRDRILARYSDTVIVV